MRATKLISILSLFLLLFACRRDAASLPKPEETAVDKKPSGGSANCSDYNVQLDVTYAKLFDFVEALFTVGP